MISRKYQAHQFRLLNPLQTVQTPWLWTEKEKEASEEKEQEKIICNIKSRCYLS